jgi:transposase
MPGFPSRLKIELSDSERAALEAMVRRRTERADRVERARIIVKSADGETISAIARQMRLDRLTVRKWIKRFLRKRMDGLEDLPRTGRPPAFSPRGSHARRKAGVRTA